jgi:hypothetical protein
LSGYETQDADFGINVCLKSWVDYYNLIYSHFDEVSNKSWQLVIAIHDEADGLIDLE